jgi:hypothetical protein
MQKQGPIIILHGPTASYTQLLYAIYLFLFVHASFLFADYMLNLTREVRSLKGEMAGMRALLENYVSGYRCDE